MAISKLSKLGVSESIGKTSSFKDESVEADIYAPISYVLVGGGGSGGEGHGGGGGAGGVLLGTKNLIKGVTYNIYIGAGGAQKNTGSNALGNFGFPTRAFNLVASGGGAGGGYDFVTFGGGSAGGQGGGLFTAASWPPEAGRGIPNQGNNGGIKIEVNCGGSGGGGAGGNGVNASGGTYASGTADGGNGGIGVDISSYLGQSAGTTYVGGGGGGGGQRTRGLGGTGGGGNGGQESGAILPTAGSINTGGGGGGGSAGGSGFTRYGMEGGNGLVIVRTLNTAASVTGTYALTTSGSYNIYKFTADGSITF
jgi:hypothetical protein